MLDSSHEIEKENIKVSQDLIGSIIEMNDNTGKANYLSAANADKAAAVLPSLLLGVENQLVENESKLDKSAKRQPDEKSNNFANFLMPEESKLTAQGETVYLQEPELHEPIDARTRQSLMRDAAQFPPVHNPDGSTTYTVVQSGLTDRPGRDSGVDYFSRSVNITVPNDKSSLVDCKYFFNPREFITKEQFEKLIEKDKASSANIDFFSHGVSTTDVSADRQALMMQLCNGTPTVNLDWTTNHVDSSNPLTNLQAYQNDTISAKRANDNKQFTAAIDDTIKEIGADHTSLIGFSHGGFFDTRYLAHRVATGLPAVDTVILTHPDVPISAPELLVNGKPELLKDSAKHSYVVGGTSDLTLKTAVIASYLSPGTPTYENGNSEERLGDNSESARQLIESEGAKPITERDRDDLATQHFLNYAGIRQLLDESSRSTSQTQGAYERATNMARAGEAPEEDSLFHHDLRDTGGDFVDLVGDCGRLGSDLFHTRFSKLPHDAMEQAHMNAKMAKDVFNFAGDAIEIGSNAVLKVGANLVHSADKIATNLVHNVNPFNW